VPPSLAQHDDLEFHWNSNSEALVWSEQGEPLQGLTGGGEREEWIFPRQWKDGNEHVFYVEMACNTMFGNGAHDDIIQPPPPDLYFQLQKADIVAVNQDARQLLFDFRVMRGLRPLVRPLYLQDYLLTRVKTLR
jgi:alpha-mannosidase